MPSLLFFAMKIVHVLRNNLGFEVLPRSVSNAIASGNALRAPYGDARLRGSVGLALHIAI
jgi:hypothetical protein